MFHNKEYIYEIYKLRSFSKAAERLHISQPALSAAVQKIEERAGAPIFERTTRPISLTPFGIEYIQSLEERFTMEEHPHAMAYDLHNQPRGVVKVSCSNLGVTHLIPTRFAEFRKVCPDVTIQIMEGTTLDSKSMLDEGVVDLLITNRPLSPDEYDRRLCYQEQLLVAVPKDFPSNNLLRDKVLAPQELGREIDKVPAERCVSLSAFQGEPFILLLRENYLRLCCDLMFQEAKMVPEISMEVENQAIAFNFADLGNGITIVSNMLICDIAETSNLNFYKLNTRYAARNAYVCLRKGCFITSAMKQLVEILTR